MIDPSQRGLTPEAKQLLSSTIRALRARLLQDLHDEADRRYRLSVPLAQAGLDETHAKRRVRLEAWLDERVRATATGRKDYDWSHVAARYFPTRVEQKCHEDPSLGVAHKCFWRLHPAKAYAWELRLQDEIRPDFTIDEPGSDDYRASFLSGHPRDAEDIRAAELKRRERKASKQTEESDGPLFDQGEDAATEPEDDQDG